MLENLTQNLSIIYQSLAFEVLLILYILAPIVIPVFLIYITLNLWLGYRRYAFIIKQDRILLELKLPKEIKKTPLAMELFLNTIHQTSGEGTFYDRNFLGKSRTWFSLEIASIEGVVKFFIWTEKRFKKFIESQLYAQYPGIEVYEVSDYTQSVNLDFDKKSMWGNELVLTKEDPYPIKTYVDYGLGKEGIKEEEKIDPITPTIELMGSMEKGEQMWIQIMARAHKGGKNEWEKEDWSEVAKKEKEKLLEELKPEKEGNFPRIATKGEQDVLAALERNIDKSAFDCGIRMIYITDKDKFDPVNIPGMMGTFKQYNSASLNGFKPSRVPSFDYPWQDYKKIRENKIKGELFHEYKRRGYFYYPYRNGKQFVLSSEELATIYHLPGAVVQTPTFTRIPSKKSEPPANLPF